MKLIKRVDGSLQDKQITVRNQAGEDVLFPEYAVTAMELENKFKLVRIHLEGSDNCVKFPDKATGEFSDLKPDVVYTIWGLFYTNRFSIEINQGHKWDENHKFKPAPIREDSNKRISTVSFTQKPFYATSKAQSSLELFYKSEIDG